MENESFRPADPITRANFNHLYADIAWFGLLAGSTMAFIAIYAARLGATSFDVGLLTAGPAVVNLLFSLPFGRWLESRPLIRVSYLTSILHRLGYVALVFLPALLVERAQVHGIILIALATAIPGTLLAISFNALIADLVPPAWRAHVVGRRNAIIAVLMTLTSLACGVILDRVTYPLNYQIVFAIGGFGALMSSYHVGKLRKESEIPPRVGSPLGDLAWPGLLRFADALRNPGLRFLTRSKGKPLLRLDVLKGSFGAFMLAYFAFYMVQYIPLPLFPLYNVNVLGLTDGEISLGSALFYGMMMVFSFGLGRFSARFGHRRLLVFAAFVFGGYPLLLYLARDAILYWAASILGGLVWGLLNGALVNRLMERVPEGDRPAHMAIHNLALNLGILAGSMMGPAIGEWIGLRDALLVSGGLRILGAVLLSIFG
ncbi:MAG: MFS transporter [Chloroflexota bacterium]|nr:MAG: MFS transporter [Chloroflexota bacterium]